MSNRALTPYLWMMLSGFCTAGMSQVAHHLKDTCDWRLVALARGGLAFLFALILARLAGASLVLWRPRVLWLRSCASSLSLLCMFYALARMPTSEVLTLTNTFPIWVAFLSWPLLGVRPTGSVWVAALCGVVGVALIKSPSFSGDRGDTLAFVLALVAALTSAIAMLGLNRVRGVGPWAIVVHYSGVATLFVLGTWTIGSPPSLVPLQDSKIVLLLLAAGALATLGQLFVTLAFTAGQPARLAVVGLTQILFALGLDLLFAKLTIHLTTVLGIVLVLAPTAWMMVGRARANSATEPKVKDPEADSVDKQGWEPLLPALSAREAK